MMEIKLTYFKDNGKYYAAGSFLLDFCSFHTIVERVLRMHHEGRLPGLVEGGGKGMFVLIQPPDGKGGDGVPHLLWPIERE